jgi:hypothetical protein
VTLVAVAGILGWRAGEAPLATAAPAAPAEWALPQVTAPQTARDVAILTSRHPWGGRAGFHDIDSAPSPTIPTIPWHLAGIIARGDERLAMILVGQGPAAKLEYRATGDSLPDGSVLVQIGTDSATSQTGEPPAARQRVHRLFEKAH